MYNINFLLFLWYYYRVRTYFNRSPGFPGLNLNVTENCNFNMKGTTSFCIHHTLTTCLWVVNISIEWKLNVYINLKRNPKSDRVLACAVRTRVFEFVLYLKISSTVIKILLSIVGKRKWESPGSFIDGYRRCHGLCYIKFEHCYQHHRLVVFKHICSVCKT